MSQIEMSASCKQVAWSWALENELSQGASWTHDQSETTVVSYRISVIKNGFYYVISGDLEPTELDLIEPDPTETNVNLGSQTRGRRRWLQNCFLWVSNNDTSVMVHSTASRTAGSMGCLLVKTQLALAGEGNGQWSLWKLYTGMTNRNMFKCFHSNWGHSTACSFQVI